jgi:hypothetical protein
MYVSVSENTDKALQLKIGAACLLIVGVLFAVVGWSHWREEVRLRAAEDRFHAIKKYARSLTKAEESFSINYGPGHPDVLAEPYPSRSTIEHSLGKADSERRSGSECSRQEALVLDWKNPVTGAVQLSASFDTNNQLCSFILFDPPSETGVGRGGYQWYSRTSIEIPKPNPR